MARLGRIIFWILIVGIFGLIAAFITVNRDYPIWVGILIFIALLLVFLIFDSITWAIRKWYKNRKIAKAKAAGEKVETAGLRLTLNNALNYIDTNHVAGGTKRFWEMPWIIFFGKSALLKSKGLKLHTHFIVGDAEDEELQRNQVYVLDNFAIWCVDEELIEPNTSKNVEKQWLDFLKYIKSQNKAKPPIDQVVIELSASMLLNSDKTDIAYNARTMKDRIEQVSQLCGYRQQVLFCISNSNELDGFREFVELVPNNVRTQAMGYIVANPLKESTSTEPLNYVSNRADEVIDIALFEHVNPVDIKVFNFPTSVRKLKENYAKFTGIFFSSTAYTEPPVLHGVYLLGEYKHNGQEDSVFYYDFIDQIQLSLIRPMSYLSSEIKQQERRGWEHLGIWYLASALAAGYLIYVYNSTSNRLVDLVKMLPKNETYSDQLEQNLLQFSDYHTMINQLNDFKGQLQIRVLPYRGGLERLYSYYSKQFVENFRHHILDLLDKRMGQMLLRGGLTDTQKAYLVQNMVTRINIIQAKLAAGASSDTLMQMPNPRINFMGYNKLPERFLNNFGDLYKDYVIWNPNQEALHAESGKLVLWLDQSGFLLSDLHWLIEWGNTQDNASEIGLNSFWIGSNVVRDYLIQPAYTTEGVVDVQSLLTQIEQALPLYIDISRQKNNFNLWFAESRLSAWRNLSLNFYKGTETLAFQYEWDQTFDSMLQPSSPYNGILRELATQFQGKLPFTPPRWIQLVQQFSDLMTTRYDGDKGIEFKRLSNVVSDWMKKLEERPSELRSGRDSDKMPPTVANKLNFNSQVNAVKAYMSYRDLLKQLYKQPYVQSIKAYTNSKGLFQSQTDLGSKEASLIMKAYQALVDMRRALEHYDQLDDSNPFWVLMRGPLDFYIDYTNRYAACYIQQKWLDEVYLKTSSLEGTELNQVLFGKGGLVWLFHKQYALPFIKQIGNSFLPRFVLNHEFPFRAEYYQLLSFGTRLNSGLDGLSEVKQKLDEKLPIDLKIIAQPTNLEPSAKALPYKTVLRIKCKDNEFVLENYNYPSQQRITKWKLDSCGPTEIGFFFPGATLYVEYPGNDGFLHFLQDFDAGIKDFFRSSFPDNLKYMQANNIKRIRASYSINGSRDVMWEIGKYLAAEKSYAQAQENLAEAVRVPQTITDCWVQGQYDV